MKHEGFTCDGGCGSTLVLDPDNALDSITHHGWYHTFTPGRMPTLTCCSAACVTEALRLNRAHVHDAGGRGLAAQR